MTVELQKPKKKKSKGAAKPVEVPRASFFRTFFRNLGAGFDEPTDVRAAGATFEEVPWRVPGDAWCSWGVSSGPECTLGSLRC